MNIAIYASPRMEHQQTWAAAFQAGLKAHGVDAEIVGHSKPLPDVDLAVVWGMRKKAVIEAQVDAKKEFLVMERGFIGDRTEWTSLAFNGLNGNGEFRFADRGSPERFNMYFGRLLRKWKDPNRGGAGRAIVLGQVPGDMSLENIGRGINAFYEKAITALRIRGFNVRFRPHPLAPQTGPEGVDLSTGPLHRDLNWTDVAVTYNSNAAVDAVLHGVPTITCDDGSMARDVTAHALDAEFEMPDRSEWCSRLAWCQWQYEEIAEGRAWAFITGRD